MDLKISDLTGLKEPITRLIEVVSAGVGKVAAPYLIASTAGAKAKEILRVAQAIKSVTNNADLDISYDEGKVAIKTLESHTFVTEATTIENRASDRILFEATKKQRCLERVTSQAALELSSEQSVPDEKPDEDWIARFFDYAKNISSEQMQGIIGILGDKLFANHFHIIPRWPMLPFIERYKDFAISGTDRGRVAQCKIEIHRQSNVLQDDIYLLLRDQRPDHCIITTNHLKHDHAYHRLDDQNLASHLFL